MEKELVEAKLNQLLRILSETERWLAVPLADFSQDTKLIRACQPDYRFHRLLVSAGQDSTEVGIWVVHTLGVDCAKTQHHFFDPPNNTRPQ